jgi:hypothetical protein
MSLSRPYAGPWGRWDPGRGPSPPRSVSLGSMKPGHLQRPFARKSSAPAACSRRRAGTARCIVRASASSPAGLELSHKLKRGFKTRLYRYKANVGHCGGERLGKPSAGGFLPSRVWLLVFCARQARGRGFTHRCLVKSGSQHIGKASYRPTHPATRKGRHAAFLSGLIQKCDPLLSVSQQGETSAPVGPTCHHAVYLRGGAHYKGAG